jgi:ABC-type phosphate transport system substrate-binding protein
MSNIASRIFLLAGLAGFISVAQAEYAFIVNPSNNSGLANDSVTHLYLAKAKSFPNGELAIPLNQKSDSASRKAFEEKIVGKSESQMKAYWSQLIFSGKAMPLKEMSDDAEVIELVGKNPSAVGYVDSSSVNESVKVLFTF